MSASTMQEMSAIEARLSTIEDALVQAVGLLGCLQVARDFHGWESQIAEKRQMCMDAVIAVFGLHAVDLEATTSATDIAIRRRQAEQRAEMQESINRK